MQEKIKESYNFLKQKLKKDYKIGIILGSGLGGLVDKIDIHHKIPYSEIPNFKKSTVAGHHSNLIFGSLAGKNVIIMQGRFHYYEGYTMQEVTFPVRVMRMLGAEYLFASNAAGGLNPKFSVGDIMLITDHINHFPENPLIGKNLDEFGVRFPDMTQAYNPTLLKIARKEAKAKNIKIQEGIYIGSSGPTLETPAEYRLFLSWGADATGMSTVPEITVGHHSGMKCFALSVITNVADKPADQETTHDEVQDVAGSVQPKLTELFIGIIRNI